MNEYKVFAGDVFEDRDSRQKGRRVRVIETDGIKATVQNIHAQGGTLKTRVSVARLRPLGKTKGFTLISRLPENIQPADVASVAPALEPEAAAGAE